MKSWSGRKLLDPTTYRIPFLKSRGRAAKYPKFRSPAYMFCTSTGRIFPSPNPTKTKDVTWNTTEISRTQLCWSSTAYPPTMKGRLCFLDRMLYFYDPCIILKPTHSNLTSGWLACNHTVYYTVCCTTESRCLCSGEIISFRK